MNTEIPVRNRNKVLPVGICCIQGGFSLTTYYKVDVEEIIIKKDLYYNNIVLLSYTIKYPKFTSNRFQRTLNRINQYYKAKAYSYQLYYEHKLFKLAIEQYEDSIANGFPVRKFEAFVAYTITYNQNCAISLYFDRYEYTGGAHGNTIRYSNTWNLQTGTQMKLSRLFANQNYEAYIIMMINQQIAEQIKNGTNQYFENYSELVTQYFNEESFYLTPQGVVIYYQQYEIAPYSSGIPTFTIPYSRGYATPPRCR